jgi:hypothetical protein
MVNVVLGEQLQAPSPPADQEVQEAVVNVNTVALSPAEHVQMMSKYQTPYQWVAMEVEAVNSAAGDRIVLRHHDDRK